MIADTNPIRSAWACKFEKLDSRGHDNNVPCSPLGPRGTSQVEMRGIEPRSDSNATGLLRVQFAKEFLSLSVSRKLGRLEQAQSTKSPLIPIDKELKQWLSK